MNIEAPQTNIPSNEGSKENNNPVDIKFDEHNFFVEISSNNMEGESAKRTVEKTVEKAREKIISLIKENLKITQEELTVKTGLTRRGIKWNLSQLKQKDLLKRIGPDKGGYWEIISK